MMETTIEDGHLQLGLPWQISLKLFCILLNMKNRAITHVMEFCICVTENPGFSAMEQHKSVSI